MSNPVDYVLMAEADGASFCQMQTGAWRALDRRAFVIVDGAESLAEAARLYCEDRGLPKAKPAMPDCERRCGLIPNMATPVERQSR